MASAALDEAATAERPALVIVVSVWGSLRLRSGDLTRLGTPVRVGLIQGNIEQTEKTEPALAAQIFTSYLSMTRQAIGHGAELVVWPESATPFMFEEDPAAAARSFHDLLDAPKYVREQIVLCPQRFDSVHRSVVDSAAL